MIALALFFVAAAAAGKLQSSFAKKTEFRDLSSQCNRFFGIL
jgi:hypothetical protein